MSSGEGLLEEAASSLGAEAYRFGRHVMDDAWDDLSEDEKEAFKSFMSYFAGARVMELAGLDIGSTLEILDEVLLQWRAIGEDVLIDAVKQTGREVLGLGGSFLGGGLRAFLEGI